MFRMYTRNVMWMSHEVRVCGMDAAELAQNKPKSRLDYSTKLYLDDGGSPNVLHGVPMQVVRELVPKHQCELVLIMPDRDRETERQRDRETERQRDTKRGAKRDRDMYKMHREREREREKTERQTDTETEIIKRKSAIIDI